MPLTQPKTQMCSHTVRGELTKACPAPTVATLDSALEPLQTVDVQCGTNTRHQWGTGV